MLFDAHTHAFRVFGGLRGNERGVDGPDLSSEIAKFA
jgi:hypothetical protein